MENCIPNDYSTYTNTDKPDTVTLSINVPGGKIGFKDSWLGNPEQATYTLSYMISGQEVASLLPQKLEESAVGETTYLFFPNTCYSGKIVKITATSFKVDLSKLSGDAVVDDTSDEEPDDTSDDTPSNGGGETDDTNDNGTDLIDDNLDSGQGGTQITDVEFCNDVLLSYHAKVDLNEITPEEENTGDQTDYIYSDLKGDEPGIEIRSSRKLKSVFWYNKNEYNSFKPEQSLPIARLNHYVIFEKHLKDLEPSNLNVRTVFRITKHNYGDDEILMQMDAETASLFGSDMGCYKIDFGASMDDYNSSAFANTLDLDNSVNLSVIKPYNVPSPTPTLTPTPTVTPTPTPTITPTPTPTDTIGTYTEVPLAQSETGLRFYMGWYGVCGYNCRPFDLTANGVRSKIFRVFQINEQNDNYSIFNTSFDSRHDNFYQDFTELECGHPYLIVLEKGTEKLVIPGFVEAKKMSEDTGRVTLKCFVDHDEEVDEQEPIQECCDGLSTSTTTTADEDLGGYNITLQNGVDGKSTMAGKLCWAELSGSAQLPTEYNCPFEVQDGSKGAMAISLRYPLPAEGILMRFESEDGVCYETTIKSTSEPNIFVKMSD